MGRVKISKSIVGLWKKFDNFDIIRLLITAFLAVYKRRRAFIKWSHSEKDRKLKIEPEHIKRNINHPLNINDKIACGIYKDSITGGPFYNKCRGEATDHIPVAYQ